MYRGLGNYLPTTPCTGLAGLGCPDCGGTCGGKLSGLGLFDTGLDWTGWGLAEWATLAFAGYVLVSMASDVRSGVGRVRGTMRKRSSASKRRDRIRKEAEQEGLL